MILELAFHLLFETVLFGVGRYVIIIATFGRVRPVTLKETWAICAQKGRAMEIYYEFVAVTLIGMITLGVILTLVISLHR
ncbi:hypothetical protein [Pseudoduganella lutea]|uniref:Uncharacterized protein n=1 Tax=Pseudoduganella lutea TaxID=321985 RepID=A0A4P6L3U0_9BURK|nr:hypothetical protein [Pseudoduganella lutea]QBE66326.1 hypothetical protein EWM63_27900 [Pseudoduganella lutea]